MTHFANILFSGPAAHPCNARCPFCIGQQVDSLRSPANLDVFPLIGIKKFIKIIQDEEICQVVFSGTNTDPLLYRHLDRLAADLRQQLPQACFSLHTNGRLAWRYRHLLNRFDKICLSLPSFNPATYHRMMGVPIAPHLPHFLEQTRIPLKLSCVVTPDNAAEIASYLQRCQALGVRRVVLRKLVGEPRPWSDLLSLKWGHPSRQFNGCPVYQFDRLEVTLWDFTQAQINAINLFSSGEISRDYHIAG
jgi:MoaA/NifB/PqqE/SkfB family radical SAM enzyme